MRHTSSTLRSAQFAAAAAILLNGLPCAAPAAASDDDATARRQTVVLVLGAAGEDEFGESFRQWAEKWREAADAGSADFVLVGDGDESTADRDRLQEIVAKQSEADLDALWIVLIGHGTFDGHAAKFNLRGPDVTAEELAQWLEPVPSPTIVINCASSSGPFLNKLAAENRIVITATRSGYELNYARFGEYLAGAIADPAADLDKDEQVSLLEAYLTACRHLQEFYEQETRLATEHALLDDNGDGLGTPPDWFRGLRATKRAKEGAALDGLRAHQMHLVESDREAHIPRKLRQRRDALEREIEALRDKKSEFSEAEYYEQLESIMVQLARVYQAVEHAAENQTGP